MASQVLQQAVRKGRSGLYGVFASQRRWLSASSSMTDPELLRNIGISAHIDSGKTTLTERILFYTGRIDAIHEVRGRDGVGAKMDSMELEREKGITIQSAATYTKWKDTNINIIDTPGHVDFTVEVERALRVLDGAIMVLCSVGGVQSQSVTVDRQMKRYKVPRVAFINKLDRVGASPWRVITELREKLKLNAAAVQIPIGLEGNLQGVVDIVAQQAYLFEGKDGETVKTVPVPDDLKPLMEKKRQELTEKLAEVDEEVGECFLMEELPDEELFHRAIRRSTMANKFVPVFMGSAFKNRGVQPLLDGVVKYLPAPAEMKYSYLDQNNGEKEEALSCDSTKPLVALAFKLEEGKFGQLTYLRIYQGSMKRGNQIRNTNTASNSKKIKIARLIRMHANEMEEVEEVGPGEICALFGVECNSGDTFTDGDLDSKVFNPTCMTMFVPSPVVSLAIKPKDRSHANTKFTKALQRFQREDPTFRVSVDPESNETIISGMGELHLDIYVERMRREYDCDTIVGAPQVNYRETITKRVNFDYLHKKQSGGAGQYGKVVGYMEPIAMSDLPEGKSWIFENGIIGNAIPPEYITAVEKGFAESMDKGVLLGQAVQGVKVVLTDGQAHSVDSSEMAFRAAARGAFRQFFPEGGSVVLEPIMSVEVEVPDDYQGNVVSGLNKRRGMILDTIARDGFTLVKAEVPLSEMFGYSTDLRSSTQAKGEFSMDYKSHERTPSTEQDRLIQEFKRAEEAKKK